MVSGELSKPHLSRNLEGRAQNEQVASFPRDFALPRRIYSRPARKFCRRCNTHNQCGPAWPVDDTPAVSARLNTLPMRRGSLYVKLGLSSPFSSKVSVVCIWTP